jgi:hypothetical protein
MYGDHLSTVHSLPVQKISFRESVVQSCRATFPSHAIASNLVKQFFHWGGQKRVLPSELKNLTEATPAGYYV